MTEFLNKSKIRSIAYWFKRTTKHKKKNKLYFLKIDFFVGFKLNRAYKTYNFKLFRIFKLINILIYNVLN